MVERGIVEVGSVWGGESVEGGVGRGGDGSVEGLEVSLAVGEEEEGKVAGEVEGGCMYGGLVSCALCGS